MTANQRAIFVGVWSRDRGLGKSGGSSLGEGVLLSLFLFFCFFLLSEPLGKRTLVSQCWRLHSSPHGWVDKALCVHLSLVLGFQSTM
jgi:hypothetical protein